MQVETRLSDQSIRVSSIEKELTETRKQASNELGKHIRLAAEREALVKEVSDLSSRLKHGGTELDEYKTRSVM